MTKGVDQEINLKAIATFAVGLVVVCILSGLLVWQFSKLLRGYLESLDPPPPPLAAAREPYLPPGPRLQAEPERDMEELLAHESSVLESYGWVDETAGIARIPIDRAIALALGDGSRNTAEAPAEPAREPAEGGAP